MVRNFEIYREIREIREKRRSSPNGTKRQRVHLEPCALWQAFVMILVSMVCWWSGGLSGPPERREHCPLLYNPGRE
jgi:hypothetical protein